MNEKIIIEALRKARIYINTVEAFEDQIAGLNILSDYITGDEIEAIDRALLEVGYVI